jgi:hypothetical protein
MVSVCRQFLGASLALTPSIANLMLLFHDGGYIIKCGMGGVHSMNWARKILVGKSEERRLLGKPERRWEDNINLYFTS